jgi:hypothetical protein
MIKKSLAWYHLIITRDEGLQILLFLLAIVIFLIYPLYLKGITNLVLVKIFFSLLAVTGIWAVSKNKKHRIIVVIVSILFLSFSWYRTVSEESWVVITSLVLAVLFNGLLSIFVLIRTLAPGPVNLFRVEGSVVVYLLMGLFFASIYALIFAIEPTAFTFSRVPSDLDLAQASLTYFSFITLTTIGYGDIQPTLPFSQSAAMMEGLVGQLFPAILIARLVSQSLQENQKQ